MRRLLHAGLWVFFFLSGATGLLYEIVWMRQLILVFGSTTHAVSAVLSAFMLGLALGSFAFGRAADRGANSCACTGFWRSAWGSTPSSLRSCSRASPRCPCGSGG